MKRSSVFFLKKNLSRVLLILLLPFLVWGLFQFFNSNNQEAGVATDSTINSLENQLAVSRDSSENSKQETALSKSGKKEFSSDREEINEQEKPADKIPTPLPETATRKVSLLVPSAWKDSKIMVDGQQAREIRRVGVYIILDIGYGSHEIQLISGDRECMRIVQVDAESKEIPFVCN